MFKVVDGFRTTDLWFQKPLLCQLSQHHHLKCKCHTWNNCPICWFLELRNVMYEKALERFHRSKKLQNNVFFERQQRHHRQLQRRQRRQRRQRVREIALPAAMRGKSFFAAGFAARCGSETFRQTLHYHDSTLSQGFHHQEAAITLSTVKRLPIR